jgi:chromate transport protein ChrA
MIALFDLSPTKKKKENKTKCKIFYGIFFFNSFLLKKFIVFLLITIAGYMYFSCFRKIDLI